ncbi:GerAB/ArcD/ProY family transporter [Cohnella sp. JJ-181]|uniref:GerAB/ArcD/ProY family transporter n=1 Tax=Cohnella rhizoplanae TaxID=2974897 RepID=UPI0022FF7C70|nr:endospore germination permease [Cohnella sp. JJ-181]CAI6033727.1 hypothetical protein COHCIP112018_00809 [Cohnella sp. JJ-181]
MALSSDTSVRFTSIIALLLLSTGMMSHVIVMPILLETGGRDAWITALIGGAAITLLVPALAYIMKTANREPIPTWLARHVGGWTAPLLRIGVFAYCWALCAVTFVDTIAWIKSVVLLQTPVWFLCLLLIIPCAWAALSPLHVLLRASALLLPPVVLFGFFVGVANMPRKNYSRLTPLLEHGALPVVHGLPYVLSGLSEIVLVLFIAHHLRRQPGGAGLLLISWVLVGLTVGPLLGAISEFGPEESAMQRFPAYEQWSLVRIGDYVEHVDVLSIFQWMAGAFARISFTLSIIGSIGFRQPSAKKVRAAVIAASITLCAAAMIPYNDAIFLDILRFVYFPFTLTMAATFVFGLTIVAAVARRRQRRRGDV